jgi:hypothetical protein
MKTIIQESMIRYEVGGNFRLNLGDDECECRTTGFKIKLPNAGASVSLVTFPRLYQPARRRYSPQAELLHVI